MSDEEFTIRRIAREVAGPRPTGSPGWKAKIYDAACAAAALGIEAAADLRMKRLEAADGHLELARHHAEEVLMARLPRADFETRSKLRARIGGIRSGNLDSAPEVQSALLALSSSSVPDVGDGS